MKAKTLFLIITVMTILVSCENFWDDNGDLGGMWQLVEWRTRSHTGEIDSLVANNRYNDTIVANHHKLYYCIHQSTMQIRLGTEIDSWSGSYFSNVTITKDKIQLGYIVDEMDSVYTYSEMKEYGIPGNGCFDIEHLDHNNLILHSDDNILKFRKY